MSRRTRIILILLGLVALYALGLDMRRTVFTAQVDAVGMVPPFTLESGLHYRRVQEIVDTGRLMPRDPDILIPHGVEVFETYSVGSEYLQAALMRLFPSSLSIPARLRWIESGWFCLGIPCLALWIGRWQRSAMAGAVAGLAYAVMVSAVIRSTGQELSRENTALPLLLAAWALAAFARPDEPAGRLRWLPAWGSALCLGLSWVTWDLTQYVLVLWVVACWGSWLAGRWRPGPAERQLLGLQLAGLWAATLLHPYLRSHGAWHSPILVGGAGVLLALWMEGRADGARWPARRRGLTAVVLLGVAGGAIFATGSGEGYGHFTELLGAKIQHFNQKPADPGGLTFNQRIMWVPALHSATFNLTRELFPGILWFSIIGGGLCLRSPRFRSDPQFLHLLFFNAAAFITFIFFVRFHVFLAIFSAALAGVVIAGAMRQTGVIRGVLISLAGVCCVLEAGAVIREPARWGRPGVYYQELVEMVDWLRDHANRRPVLANFGTSAAILTYAGCPIILHPKFENPTIRGRVEDYGNALFTGSERVFRQWATAHGAVYYVYGKGEFASYGIPYQMRYFVDAVDAGPDVAARRFEAEDPSLVDFRALWSNRKYTIYRIRTAQDEQRAWGLGAQAETAFQEGDWDRAVQAAQAALALDPTNPEALRIADLVARLRAKGVDPHGD